MNAGLSLRVQRRLGITVLGYAVAWGAFNEGEAHAQANRRPAPPANSKTLDQQAEKAMNDYFASMADLATKYEESGNREKASEMLKSILKLKPDAEIVKSRIKTLEEAVFNENVQTIDFDTSTGWASTGIMVMKDKPVRIEADGSFRVSLTDAIGPAGYPTQEVMTDVVEGVPVGALMAVVGRVEMSSKRGNQKGKDEPKVVAIGTQREFVPTETGPLFLKVNLPSSARVNGKLKVKITGNMAPVR